MSKFYTEKFEEHSNAKLKGYFLLWEKNTTKQELLEIFFINTNPAGHIVVYIDTKDNIYLLRMDGFAKEQGFVKADNATICFADNSKMMEISNAPKFNGKYKLGKVYGEVGTQFESKKALVQYVKKEGKIL